MIPTPPNMATNTGLLAMYSEGELTQTTESVTVVLRPALLKRDEEPGKRSCHQL